MPLENQAYGKIDYIGRDIDGGLHIYLKREDPIPDRVIRTLRELFQDKDVIVSIKELKRNKGNNDEQWAVY